MGRVDVKDAVKSILEDLSVFYKIYTEPTDVEKEKSFPIAWIYLSGENITDGDISYTNYMRNITLEITVGVKHQSVKSIDLDVLIDRVFEAMKTNYTLTNTVINLTPLSVLTDRGMFHPYAFASLTYELQVR